MIADGSVTVTAVRLLSDALTETNHLELLRTARSKSKREVEEIIAALRPQPAVAPSIRKVATPGGPPVASLPISAVLAAQTSVNIRESRCLEHPPQPALIAKPVTVAPRSADQYKIQFTVPKTTHDKLRRVQDLMRHTNPKGDPAVIFDRALTLLLGQLETAKLGKTVRPRAQQRATHPGSRHVPSPVKREVWARDGGQCAFAGTAGRCRETGFQEFHHVVPFAEGGPTTATNIQLRCRAHNAYEAEEWFGSLVVRERQPHEHYLSDAEGMNSATAAISGPAA
jgi:5-methylcytosine-specific restriction endonuclease McrA